MDGEEQTTQTAVAEAEPTQAPAVETQQPPAEQAAETQPAGQGQGQAQAQPAGWDQQALPAGHWALQSGARTNGDLERLYRESSGESRRNREEADRLRDQLTDVVYERMKSGRQEQQPAAAKPKAQVPGFASVQEYNAAWQANPGDAIRRMVQGVLTESPETLHQLVQPALQPLQAQAQLQNRQAEFATFVQRNPEFGPQGALHKPAYERIVKMGLSPELAAQIPVEVAFKAGAYDLLAQQLRALQTNQQARAAQAGTARAGVGGTSAPRGDTPEAIARAAAAKMEAESGQKVSEAEIQAQIESLKRFMPAKK